MSARRIADLVLEAIQDDVRIVDLPMGDEDLSDLVVRDRSGRPLYRIAVHRLSGKATFNDVSLDARP